MLNLPCAACHGISGILPDRLPLPGELVDRLTDTLAGLLILFGCPLAKS
jgi:hypothetical protein